MNGAEMARCRVHWARHLMDRAVQARPRRAVVAAWLVARYATAPDSRLAAATPRSRAAVRVSERLIGVPAGTTRAALGEGAATP